MKSLYGSGGPVSPMFFCVGMPKAGTSSLFYWLNDHPQMAGANPKETFFFMDPAHPMAGRQGLSVSEDGIAAFESFYESSSRCKVRFEGTTHAFYQDVAREYLTGMQPSPRVAMLLREPAARLFSSFQFTRDNLANCDRSFTFNHYIDCLLAGETEKLDFFYTDADSLWIAKRELELGRYVRWIDWWLERLSRDRLRLILFEQMRTEPLSTTMDLCEWLNVDAAWYSGYEFTRRNKTYAVGKQGFHRVVRRLAPLLPRNSIREQLKARYLRWQQRTTFEDRDYQDGIQRVRAYFAPANQELSDRYGLDLERWWGKQALCAD